MAAGNMMMRLVMNWYRFRLFVVGRKGWLFSDTVAGAQASANLYSLVETCKANGIDPYRYLACLFAKLPLANTVDDYVELLPWILDDARSGVSCGAGLPS